MKVATLVGALEKAVCQQKKQSDKPFSVEQDKIVSCADVRFYPSDVKGKASSVEMYHKNVTQTAYGDNVHVNVNGFNKRQYATFGDEICIENPKSDPKKTNPAKSYEKYTALVIVQDHTGRLKYSQHDAKSHGYTGVYVCRV